MIRFLIYLYMLVLIADTLVSYFPQWRTQRWALQLKKLADYSLNPVRRILPPGLPLDASPLVVILLLQLLIILF
jgi:uncharacterized protein YggT (Ycf19 family)